MFCPRISAPPPPPEMQVLVEEWKASSEDAKERALLALRFVQDEVRYLGFEEGMGAFKPSDPSLTFKRRFGDCKDKTFLLHALLQLMDISSTPVLVDSDEGKLLPDALPGLLLFDHVILRIEIDDSPYCVDPTCSLQGGSLESNFFRDYGYGLLISKDSIGLTPLPSPVAQHPIEFNTSFVVSSDDSARVSLVAAYCGSSADRVRRSFKERGLKQFTDDCLSDIQKKYAKATPDAPVSISDDRRQNIFTINESYSIPMKEWKDHKVIEVRPYTIKTYVDSDVAPGRSSPYALFYPLWVKEHVHIESVLGDLVPRSTSQTQLHESLSYTYSREGDEKSADLYFELKHLKDHVPQGSLQEYRDVTAAIDEVWPIPVRIYFPSKEPLQTPMWFSAIACGFATLAWLGLYFGLRKKRPTQDALLFYLNRFSSCYSCIITLCLISLGFGTACVLALVAIFLVGGRLSYCIIFTRSLRAVLVYQVIVGLQIALITAYLLYTSQPQHALENILKGSVCWLYLGYCFRMLHLAKKTLLQERRTLESTG